MKTNKTYIRHATLGMASLAAAMAASSLASCSSENQVIDEPRNGTEIRFNVSTDRPSRALPYTDKDQITNFKVAAWYHGDDASDAKGTYFNAEDMKLIGETWKYGDADKVRYWPNNGEKLDFHAWVDYANLASMDAKASKGYKLNFDGDGKATLTKDDGTDIPVLDSNEAVDLLYAAVFDQEHDGTDAKSVSLTYNHAYAQVGVTAKVDNPKIHMIVKEVALVNIYSKGKFNFPDNSNDAKWTTTANDAAGKVTFSQAEDAVWTLSSEKQDFNEDGNRFMVLPQTVEESKDINSPCIRLLCKVWNVTNGTSYVNGDLLIYGDDENTEDGGYKYLYVPVDFNWEMGKNYTYNLSFGNGNAGLGEDGNPTLVLMTWKVDMDDWGTPEDKKIDDKDSKEEEVNP